MEYALRREACTPQTATVVALRALPQAVQSLHPPDGLQGQRARCGSSTLERRRRVHIDGEEVLARDDALAGRRLAERLRQLQRARAACCWLPRPCATQQPAGCSASPLDRRVERSVRQLHCQHFLCEHSFRAM